MRVSVSPPVLMLGVAQTVIWAALFYIFPIFLLRWEVEFGWGRQAVSFAFTLALIAAAAASPHAGRIIDRGGAPLMFPLAAGGGALCLFALSLVESQAAFMALWALIGFACAFCLYEPCFAFITRIHGAAAKGPITTVTLMAGFASTLCYPLADALADAYGWRAAVQIFAGGAALIAVPLFALAAGMMERAAPAERPTAADNAAAAKRAFRRPVFWLLVVAFPLMAAIHGMFTSHILPLLQDRGASSAGAVFAASLIGPAQVAARILMTIGARNLSAVAISGLCFLGMALAAAVLWIAGAAGVGVFVFVALMGGAAGVTSIVRPLTAQDLLGRDGFGGISGALATPYIAMSAAAPILAALLWSAGGYELMLLAAFIAAIIGGGLIAISPRAAAIDPTTRTG